MATHDYVIANQTGANTRSDLNNLFSAIVSQNSSGSEPATKYAYMVWADTGNGVLKIRNAGNNAWLSVYSLTTGANTGSLPLAGGQMTGNITFSGTQTVDGVDISARDAVLTSTTTLATNALPKAGGTMTGNTVHGDNVKDTYGDSADLEIYHDGSNSIIHDNGTGNLLLKGDNLSLRSSGNESYVTGVANGEVSIYYDNSTKIETTANGITVTGTAIATTNTDATNTGSVTLDFGANQNFVLTLTGAVTLANPSTEQVGQSGFITFIQDSTGGRTVALGTDYETAGGSGLTLTSTANATDIVPYVVVAANRILLGTPQLAFA